MKDVVDAAGDAADGAGVTDVQDLAGDVPAEGTCTPNCIPGTCGADGCGETCACGDKLQCVNEECVCPGKMCGDQCCLAGETCIPADEGSPAHCCIAVCGDKECGFDGCGGQCGICPGGMTCFGSDCVEPGEECDDDNDFDWDGCGGGVIAEFQLSSTPEGDQRNPAVAALSDGSFVAVWESFGHGTDGSDLAARRFTVPGPATWATQFPVQESGAGEQTNPDVAGLTDGGFVVVWEFDGAGSEQMCILGQVFQADGTPDGDQFPVSLTPGERQIHPSVEGLPDGRFAVAWEDRLDEDEWGSAQIHYRQFPSEGPDAGLVQVSSNYQTNRGHPDLGTYPDGRSVVVWHAHVGEETYEEVFARFINADGSFAGAEFQVSTSWQFQQSNPAVAPLGPQGQLDAMVVWQRNIDDGGWETWDTYGERLDADGSLAGDNFEVAGGASFQEDPAVGAIGDSALAVAWVGDGGLVQGGEGMDIFHRVLQPDGTPVSEEQFQTNEYERAEQSGPDVAVLVDGSFVVVWQFGMLEDYPEYAQDGHGDGVFGQRFDAQGNRIGPWTTPPR